MVDLKNNCNHKMQKPIKRYKNKNKIFVKKKGNVNASNYVPLKEKNNT